MMQGHYAGFNRGHCTFCNLAVKKISISEYVLLLIKLIYNIAEIFFTSTVIMTRQVAPNLFFFCRLVAAHNLSYSENLVVV